MKIFFSTILIITGIACLTSTAYYIWQRNTPARLAFSVDHIDTAYHDRTTIPRELIIEDLSIRLPIIPANYTEGRWEATNQGVSYLESSPPPGEIGNSILYGHNFPRLLGRLTKIKPGAEIVIIDNDDARHTFIVEYTSIVTPDQTHILNQSDDKRITLYTCTGFLDSKRFVAVALLQS